MKVNTANFDALISSKQSGWQTKAQDRMVNKPWRDKAFDIALKVLHHIRSYGITQVQLAESMGVSPQYIHKILQGKENLTLETICKIEFALNIHIVEVVYSETIAYELNTFKTDYSDILITKCISKESVDLNSIGYEIKQIA